MWLSVGPLAQKFPHLTPYNFTENNPINLIDPDGRAAWQPGEEPGTWVAEAGDGAETLARDANIPKEQAYAALAAQGYGTYTDKDGVVKSAVDPGDVVRLDQGNEGNSSKTGNTCDPEKVEHYAQKLTNLNTKLEQKVEKLDDVIYDYNYYRKGPPGASEDPSTGSKIGYGINALRKELERNGLMGDTSELGKLIRLYNDSLNTEIRK